MAAHYTTVEGGPTGSPAPSTGRESLRRVSPLLREEQEVVKHSSRNIQLNIRFSRVSSWQKSASLLALASSFISSTVTEQYPPNTLPKLSF